MDDWKDVSSFAQGDKRRIPNSFQLGADHTWGIKVHRHIDMPGEWCLTCYGLNLKALPVGPDLAQAKKRALELVGEKLRDILFYYGELGVDCRWPR
jgi:hypothetical protein